MKKLKIKLAILRKKLDKLTRRLKIAPHGFYTKTFRQKKYIRPILKMVKRIDKLVTKIHNIKHGNK